MRKVHSISVARCLLLFSLALSSVCCSGADEKPKLDLVGKGDSKKMSQATVQKAEPAPSKDLFTVDLIQDLLFRKKRDGWSLDTPEANVNMEKLSAAGMDLVFCAIPGGQVGSEELARSVADMEEMISATGGRGELVSSFSKALEAMKTGSIPFMLLLEGADPLSGDSDEIYELKRKGLAAVGLVAGRSNAFGDCAVYPVADGGLTGKGRSLVQTLRDQGILVDLTHASEDLFWDVLVEQGSLAAVTHTAAKALRDHPRNLDDIQILALARYGGVMGIVINPDFLVKGDSPDADMEDMVRHMVHVKNLGAVQALALGTDFGGVRPPEGLEDVSRLPALANALYGAGFSSDEVEMVMGGNARRLLEEVETRQGVAEGGREEPLRPIEAECDSVIGEYSGAAVRSCDGYLLDEGPVLEAATRLKLRLTDMSATPVKVEVFGEPGTPWQVEAQNLEGKVLMRRGVALGPDGRGILPLPKGRNLTRVFLSPTRKSSLKEVVLWGR